MQNFTNTPHPFRIYHTMFTPRNLSEKPLILSPYCRVSTDSADQINSLQSQLTYFTQLINSRPNWTLGEVYYDEGITGTSTKNRISFNRMIEDAKSGKLQMIITKEVSRFARNTVDTLFYTRTLKAHGVGVYFVLDNISTLDPDGELRLTLMASLAQEESRKTSQRVKWGQKRMMERGFAFGGSTMFGFTITDGCIAVNPKQAPYVQLIFEQFLDGSSCYTIARQLNEMGVRTVKGKLFSHCSILRILKNERYAGDLRQQKTHTPDFLTHKNVKNKAENTLYIPDNHPPIIERAVFIKAQELLERKNHTTDPLTPRFSNRYFCSGKAVCGNCGATFIRSQQKRTDETKSYSWRCANAVFNGSKRADAFGKSIGCKNHRINERVLLACLDAAIKFADIDTDALTKDISKISAPQILRENPETAPLYSKIADYEARKIKAIDLAVQGLISSSDLTKQQSMYNAQIAELQQKITHAEKNCTNLLPNPNTSALAKRKALHKIEVFQERTLIFHLTSVPHNIQIEYSVSGRTSQKSDTYTVHIDSIGITPKVIV